MQYDINISDKSAIAVFGTMYRLTNEIEIDRVELTGSFDDVIAYLDARQKSGETIYETISRLAIEQNQEQDEQDYEN